MLKNLKTKVIEIKEAPMLKNPAMLSGIRDKAAAQAWGTKYGYETVYYWSNRQRVYAERLQVRVDKQAKQIEFSAKELADIAEETARM